MKYFTSAALALVLAGAAASAQADPPDDHGHHDHAVAGPSGHPGGGGGAPQGGQVHGGAPQGGGQPQFHSTPGAFHSPGYNPGQGGGQPGGGHVDDNRPSFQGGGPSGGNHPDYSHQQVQGGGQFVPGGGQGWQHDQGGHDDHGGYRGDYHGGPDDRGGGQFHADVQFQVGPHYQGWQGARGNDQRFFADPNRRGGEGWDHPYRARDRGREWFNPGEFPRGFRAEHRFHVGEYRYPGGWFNHYWNYGDYLPWGWYSSYYYLNWDAYDLPPPPIGCEWVRVGADALLVDVWTGEVLSVDQGLFW
jgi:Ni/Co efflux regulator RcnB